MRENSKSYIIYAMFLMLIVVFAFSFGPGSGGGGGGGGTGNDDYAARVDGDPIPRGDFAQLYNRRLDMLRSSNWGGGRSAEELADQLGLRKQIIDGLIEQKLLTHEAVRRGLTVDDAELLDELKERLAAPAEPDKYEAWVSRNFGSSPRRFEERLRTEMSGRKLESMLRDNVSVSDDEIKATFVRDNDKAQIFFVRFDTRGAIAEEPDASAVEKLLADETDAVQARYTKDELLYRSPREVHARQIMKSLSPDASDADVAAARGTLLELKDKLDGGADFAALAKEHSDDAATKDKGGDMGFLKLGQMDPAVMNKLFAMKKDEISAEPIRSRQGLHLMQVVEIKQPDKRPFDEVKQEVAKAMLRDRLRDAKAQAQAQELLEKLRAGEALETLTLSEQEKRDAADLQEEPKDSDAPQATDKPVRFESPWILKTQESIPGIGTDAELQKELFAMSADKPLASKVYKVNGSFFVVRLKERQTPDLEKFKSDLETLRERELGSKRSKVYKQWLDHLRSKATIEYNQAMFGTMPNNDEA